MLNKYAGKPREQQSVESEWEGAVAPDGSPEIRSKFKIVQKTLFPTENGTRFVAVSANEVSIHTLAPYDGWDAFRDRISDVLSACGDAGRRESASRIAVRFINRVSFPSYNVPLGTYFTKAPEYPEGVPVVGMTNFLSRVECEYPDDSIRLVLVMADTGPKRVEAPYFLLDLEVAWANTPERLALAAALPKIEDLKGKGFSRGV